VLLRLFKFDFGDIGGGGIRLGGESKLTARGGGGMVDGGSVNGAFGDIPRGGLSGPVRGLTEGMFIGIVCAEYFGGGGIDMGGASKSGTRAGDATRGGV
jgi:hypothetical protein